VTCAKASHLLTLNSSCLFVCDGAGLFMHGYLEESCGCCEKSASVLKAGGLRHQQKRSPKRRDSLERSNKAAKKKKMEI